MKKTLIWVASVIGAGAVLSLAHVYLTAPTETRMVAVSGDCLTTAPKDRTAITLRVTMLDKSAAVSMKKAQEQMKLLTMNIQANYPDAKLQTTQFNSYEKTEWDHVNQKSVNLGIETTIAMEVSAEKMETIETIIAIYGEQENLFTENLRMFTSRETLQPILEKCLGDATQNARERATAIAIADGRKVGKMISAGYGSGGGSAPVPAANFMRAKLEMASMDMATGGGLVSKDTEVSVSVSAIFEIK